MSRALILAMSISLVAGCGDRKYEETLGPSSGSVPGSTTGAGSVAANIDGEQFVGRLQTGASYREGVLSFNGYDGFTRQLAISVRDARPGSFEVGNRNAPSVSLIEGFGSEAKRWTIRPITGTGSLTISFISADAASGYFDFVLFPDSAAAAAGITNNRIVGVGSFSVNLSR